MKKLLQMMALAFAILMPQTIVASSDASHPVVPVTIKKDKDNKGKVKFMPEKGIEIELLFVDGTVTFLLPFDEYPVNVEIEGISGTVGYWTSTITYAGEAMDFDGACGEYRLVLTVGDADYVGYFSID